MLLIDAIYINDGGGKVLLDYLIEGIESTDVECLYLLDNRIKNNHPSIKSSNLSLYIKSGLWRRLRFYRKHKSSFSKVFCMGNLPPNVKIEAEVITYFHSPLYLETPVELSLSERIKYILKRLVLKRFDRNTDLWLVQTEIMKRNFGEKFNINNTKVSLMPFYPPFDECSMDVAREDNTFLFVSNATAHKNHGRLVEAFCIFFDEYKIGKLILTVSKEYEQVVNLIDEKIAEGYPVVNVGFVGREHVKKLYLSSQYLIFPSVAESFGLGLVEAIDNGCKVIGADLPYTYAVCEPSIVFDPYKVESIICAFKQSLYEDVEISTSLINDEVAELISLLNT